MKNVKLKSLLFYCGALYTKSQMSKARYAAILLDCSHVVGKGRHNM